MSYSKYYNEWMSLHESRPDRKSILPFPEPMVDRKALRSASAVVNATFAYQEMVESHIKERESTARGLTFGEALTRVSMGIPIDRLSSIAQTSWAGRSGPETLSINHSTRTAAMGQIESHAKALFPERFGIAQPQSMERGQAYDVDGTHHTVAESKDGS